MLETAVVTWTLQIKDVLKKDPEHVFQDGGHPGPMIGLDFWSQKASDLHSIQRQLSSDKITKVMKVLELTKSPYYAAFKLLCKEVDAAYAEATDNVSYLKPLREYFEALGAPDTDFKELPELFKPIMHILLMVWEHSKYYNNHISLAVLMRQICNDVIEQATLTAASNVLKHACLPQLACLLPSLASHSELESPDPTFGSLPKLRLELHSTAVPVSNATLIRPPTPLGAGSCLH